MDKKLFHKKELILILIVALLAGGALLLMTLFGDRGNSVTAQVTYNGSVVDLIDLSKDAVYHFEADYPVTLEVKEGAIRFIHSVCPNHDCEGFGFIDTPPESAICLPAKVAVQIIDSDQS